MDDNGATRGEGILGPLDLHLFGEGRHERLYEHLGAHVRSVSGVRGCWFSVWAPNARHVAVVGDFNAWEPDRGGMHPVGSSGVWSVFVPHAVDGARYKYAITNAHGATSLRADPFAFRTEEPPKTASVIHESNHAWGDDQWMRSREKGEFLRKPMSIYEVHLASWRLVGDRALSYREMGEALAAYAVEMGFTHVELMPVMEHPFGGSWGYQVTGYFAPTARFGAPDDLRAMIDTLHAHGVGVILDWVPAHFPKDEWALARFDGTALYEHLDPREGEHPDWGTLVFNLGRHEVRNFLLASAMYWMESFHADGLRVDAVASLLYRDYSRKEGEWVPNQYGGRENLEAIAFLRDLNTWVHRRFPGAYVIAEESTAWPGVSRPVEMGGLGFSLKWDMGFMHDSLAYFAKDPVHRQHHHSNLTFGLLYAHHENFILPLSHDEVVHGKGSLLTKMPGDPWKKFANLRALYSYMWGHPGRKMLFMGGELGMITEWDESRALDWSLLGHPLHDGLRRLVRDLNHLYRSHPAFWDADSDPVSFTWLDVDSAHDNVIAFERRSRRGGDRVVCACNFSDVVRHRRLPVGEPGSYREILNSDGEAYGGANVGNGGVAQARSEPLHGFPASIDVVLPSLGVVFFERERASVTIRSA